MHHTVPGVQKGRFSSRKDSRYKVCVIIPGSGKAGKI